MKTVLQKRNNPQEEAYRPISQLILLIALFCFLIFFTSEIFAQSDKGSVTVSLFDKENNESIPFANVVVYQNGVQVKVGTTNMDGECAIIDLSPGKYDVKAVYVGYEAKEIKNITLEKGQLVPLKIELNSRGISCYSTICCCCCCCGGCGEYRTENWWPKLWTPYREWYAAYKEKREAKKSQEKPKVKPEPEPSNENPIVDSIENARISIVTITNESVTIFPNPVRDVLHIESSQLLQHVQIMDAAGKLIQEEDVQNTNAAIKLNNYTNGIYYINYSVNSKMESKKIVVLN